MSHKPTKFVFFFAKDFFGVKKCTSKSFTFLSNFWGALHPWSGNFCRGKSARQDKHRLQKQPIKYVHAICKFSLKYAKRILLHRLKCNV